MADDKRNTGRQNRDRINIEEAYEVQYWSEKLVSKNWPPLLKKSALWRAM